MSSAVPVVVAQYGHGNPVAILASGNVNYNYSCLRSVHSTNFTEPHCIKIVNFVETFENKLVVKVKVKLKVSNQFKNIGQLKSYFLEISNTTSLQVTTCICIQLTVVVYKVYRKLEHQTLKKNIRFSNINITFLQKKNMSEDLPEHYIQSEW